MCDLLSVVSGAAFAAFLVALVFFSGRSTAAATVSVSVSVFLRFGGIEDPESSSAVPSVESRGRRGASAWCGGRL
jgi:hypothetical protein